MIVCPACHHQNPEDVTTCQRCGGSLVGFAYRGCPRCGVWNPPDNTFCNRCLTRIRETEALPGGQEASECVSPFTPGGKSIPPQHPAAPTVRHVRDKERGVLGDAVQYDRRTIPRQSEDVAPSRSPAQPADVAGSMLPRKPVRRPPRLAGEEPSQRQSERAPFRGVPQSWDELDLLPIEAAIARPHRPTYVPPRQPTEEEQEQAALLEQLAMGPPPLGARRRLQEVGREPVAARLVRLVLALLLMAAALMATLGQGRLADSVVPREGVLELAETLEALGPGDTVLLAFAYSPSYSGEMAPLVDVVVATLAARGARIVAVGVDPAGVALARQALAKAEQAQAGYAYGTHYVIAGYLSGYQAGVRSLCEGWGALQVDAVRGRPLGEWAVTAELADAGDVRRVILLADDGATARVWIEQFGRCVQAPLDALVTGQLETVLTPYLLSGQLAHLVAGGVAAGELEAAMGMPSQALRWADGYVALLVILVLAAVAANVFYVSTESA